MIIGIDIDDVIYPWYDEAHKVMVRFGVTYGVTPVTWHPYEEYGMTRENWRHLLGEATVDGSLFLRGEPMEGVKEGFDLIHSLGHEIHLVTSRGYLPRGEVAQAQTVIWLSAKGLTYEHLTFTENKASVRLDVLIDDLPKNLIAASRNGTRGVLVSQSWNMDHPAAYRVNSVLDFANALEITSHTDAEVPFPLYGTLNYGETLNV